ncbi:murein L,D-transpeptidase family protein [Acidobacteriota bacterium]
MRYLKIIIVTGFLLFPFLWSFTAQDTKMHENGDADFVKFSSDLVPSPLIHLENNSTSHLLLVEKRNQKLYVLNQRDGFVAIQKTFLCSTGVNIGDKKVQGDKKTPEGIYFMIEKKAGSKLPAMYGVGAYVLDYPNIFDRFNRKNGSGIWIHGTDDPKRLLNSYETNGCVVLKDEDFLALSGYVELNKTPIVIVDEIEYRKKEFVETDRKELLGFLDKWKKSWEEKDLDGFIGTYSKNFRLNSMNYQSYRAHKRRLFRLYDWINVKLDDIQIFQYQRYILINFLQDYSTNNFSDLGVKQLFLTKENNQYKIIKERWTELSF